MSHFRKAFDRAPLPGPDSIQDLQGPSYIWAIPTDPRVARRHADDEYQTVSGESRSLMRQPR